MSEQFKFGQAVWHKACELESTVRAHVGDRLWVEHNGLDEVHPAGMFTSTDPNQSAEPMPQNCPFCGAIPDVHDSPRWAGCSDRDNCAVDGPIKPTRLEAIRAWNSIRVGDSISDPTLAEIEEIAHGPRIVQDGGKTADSDPLTEEWLRKVGLWDGVTVAPFEPLTRIFLTPFAGQPVANLSLSSSRGTIITTSTLCKTTGCVRQLCRLLGVPLKQ